MQAFQEGLYGSKYAWIVVSASTVLALDQAPPSSPCSRDQLQPVIDGVLITDILQLSTSTDVTVAGLVS